MENKFTPEIIEKARRAESAEELLTLAEENGIELSEPEAKAYFEQLHKTGELSDDELDNVAGGGCYYKDGRLVVTAGYYCRHFTCKKCGNSNSVVNVIVNEHLCKNNVYHISDCNECKYRTNKGARMVCNHPDNYRK